MASVVGFVLEHEPPHRVAAFGVDRDRLDRTRHDNLDVIPFDQIRAAMLAAPGAAPPLAPDHLALVSLGEELGIDFPDVRPFRDLT